MIESRTLSLTTLAGALICCLSFNVRAEDRVEAHPAAQTASEAAANDERDCAQQDRAYVAMLACSRLLMSRDIDQAKRGRLLGLRGRAALILFDFVEAAEDFSEVLAFEPDNLAALVGRAEALSEHGAHAKAAEDWAHIARLKADDVAARMKLGLSLNAASAYEKAVAAFEDVLKLDASNPEAYVGLARALDMLDRRDKADESIAAALKINPSSNSALIAQAEIAERRGDTKLAIESYSQALKANGMQIKPRQALQRLGVETPMPR